MVRLLGNQLQYRWAVLQQTRAVIASHRPRLTFNRNRCAQRIAVLTLIPNRLAAGRADAPSATYSH